MCAVHFVFVMLAVTSLTFGSRIQTVVAHIISVLVSILLLCKMIYQIENIKHDTWIVNCTVSSSLLIYTLEETHLHCTYLVCRPWLGLTWLFIHKTPLSTFKCCPTYVSNTGFHNNHEFIWCRRKMMYIDENSYHITFFMFEN